MWHCLTLIYSRGPHRSRFAIAILALCILVTGEVWCQTASTGAVTGLTLDPSGAILQAVTIQLVNNGGKVVNSSTSDQDGRFGFMLLLPGDYELRASRKDFTSITLPNLHVSVTETIRVELHLGLATHLERTEAKSDPLMVQLDTSSLGRVVDEQTIRGLPLVTRNFAQITGLSPGVIVGVYNAGELGSGGTALAQVGPSNDGIFAHGSRSYQNSWRLDGADVTDIQAAGSASGGIPTPNPDALEEFKVQTGMYDAEFGRTSGAAISVVTKSGTDAYHGNLFEYLRNDFLNANDFFFNRTGQRKPVLKQNQFGFTFGGPIPKAKSSFFASYQGTRQVNGVAAGQARIGCTVSLNEPPITNDRSRAALGQLFAGMSGAKGGVAVAADGSNINPVALALLSLRLPDGSFLIPTPQTVDPTRPFATSGFSTISQPCHFDEDQGLGNIDYNISQKSRLVGRFFISQADQFITFPGSGQNPTGNTRGFDSPVASRFIVFSAAHTYVVNDAVLNEARIGFVRTRTQSDAQAPFKWSDVGVSEGELNRNNELPDLNVLGSVSMASALPRTYTQNTFSLSDTLSWLRGGHAMKFGASIARLEEYFDIVGLGSSVQFLSWPDFLLGLDANSNGTGTFSNVFASSDIYGLLNRDFRAWEGAVFAQDDYRLARSITLNFGLRYERLGHFEDKLGRNSSFDIRKADPNPPPGGSLNGYLVSSNFPGTPPPGVLRTNNEFGTYGEGQNTLAPRFGFAWQILPSTTRLALRGGYGIYYSRPTGGASAQSITGAPFSLSRITTGLANASATFQTPFQMPFPTAASFPMFVPYSATGKSTVNTLSPAFRPEISQDFGLNIQAELRAGWLLEVGYVGSQAMHLQRFRSLNQALPATVANPIRGVTTNTLANLTSRVPVPGIPADALREMESEGASWYNSLAASLTKRLSHGFQFLASYTFSKTLDTDGANINGATTGSALTLGDQNSPRQRWGRASFDRTHRFVLSGTWLVPGPSRGGSRIILGGWSLAGIVTIQSGSALTVADTNSANLFGISEDRAQLSGACSKDQFVRGGTVQSKLNDYFNASCFTTPPIISADGVGTGFGNSETGIVDGPGQASVDLALSKTVSVQWPIEKGNLQFRAELYNALNHPQFANPDSNFTSQTFGVISSTAVNARVGQLSVKFQF